MSDLAIRFTVYGNHEGRKKNPTPFHAAQGTQQVTVIKDMADNIISKKKTYLPSFDKQVKKYHKYCQHVRNALAEKIQEFNRVSQDGRKGCQSSVVWGLLNGKRIILTPVSPKTHLYHLNMIYFANDARGDAENVSKGIIDAIHKQDKYVEGAFPYTYDKENPRVEVLITTDVDLYDQTLQEFHQKVKENKNSLFREGGD